MRYSPRGRQTGRASPTGVWMPQRDGGTSGQSRRGAANPWRLSLHGSATRARHSRCAPTSTLRTPHSGPPRQGSTACWTRACDIDVTSKPLEGGEHTMHMAADLRNYRAGAGTRTRNRPITSRERCQLRHAGGGLRSYLRLAFRAATRRTDRTGGPMAGSITATWANTSRIGGCSSRSGARSRSVRRAGRSGTPRTPARTVIG